MAAAADTERVGAAQGHRVEERMKREYQSREADEGQAPRWAKKKVRAVVIKGGRKGRALVGGVFGSLGSLFFFSLGEGGGGWAWFGARLPPTSRPGRSRRRLV